MDGDGGRRGANGNPAPSRYAVMVLAKVPQETVGTDVSAATGQLLHPPSSISLTVQAGQRVGVASPMRYL